MFDTSPSTVRTRPTRFSKNVPFPSRVTKRTRRRGWGSATGRVPRRSVGALEETNWRRATYHRTAGHGAQDANGGNYSNFLLQRVFQHGRPPSPQEAPRPLEALTSQVPVNSSAVLDEESAGGLGIREGFIISSCPSKTSIAKQTPSPSLTLPLRKHQPIHRSQQPLAHPYARRVVSLSSCPSCLTKRQSVRFTHHPSVVPVPVPVQARPPCTPAPRPVSATPPQPATGRPLLFPGASRAWWTDALRPPWERRLRLLTCRNRLLLEQPGHLDQIQDGWSNLREGPRYGLPALRAGRQDC